jgi:hypothetical protein
MRPSVLSSVPPTSPIRVGVLCGGGASGAGESGERDTEQVYMYTIRTETWPRGAGMAKAWHAPLLRPHAP